MSLPASSSANRASMRTLADRYVATASPLAAEMRQELRPTLLLLVAAAALVLLIACVSVGNLTLTRFTRRWREMQLRSALGATRRRIASQLLAENVSAVCAGVLLGLLLAQFALRALTVYVQRSTSLPGRSRPDHRGGRLCGGRLHGRC